MTKVDPVRRVVAPTASAIVIFAVLVGGGLLYAAGGGASRDALVTQGLINAVMVVGLQIYIGNTGILSFGHMGFASIAGYAFAVTAISPDRKQRVIPDAPFGLGDVHLTPLQATLVAVVVTVAVGALVGLGLARSGAKSGAVSATVITLALLFMTHEVAINWTELTGGDRAGLTFTVGQTLQGRGWIYLALVCSLVAAAVFKASNTGRLAQASREDDLAARAVGINPVWPQMAALLLSVAVVAVAASLRVYQLGTITPKFFFFEYTLLTLVMLIVGGRNSLTGAMAGVALMTAGNEVTRYLAGPDVDVTGLGWLLRDGLSQIFLGGAMLGFMILRPGGLLGDWELDRWALRRFRTSRETAPPAAAPLAAPSPEHVSAAEIEVTFGGFRVLDRAYLDASNHEVVGIIGPNGAGKTTLLNVITGIVAANEGRVTLDGVDLTNASTYRIARAGLVRTFQNLRLYPALTVRENVETAAIVAGRHRRQRSRADVDALLVRVGLWDVRERRARELDYGTSRRLELARAAASAPSLLLLDEPTSGMSDTESLGMIALVRDTAAAVGAGVIVIDHDLGFITGICDRIYCLDQGEVIAVGDPGAIQADPRVQAAYLGTAAPSAGVDA